MDEKLIVNLNEADLETIQQLPGIGKSLAERIIDRRPYQRVDDLLEVQGVGGARFERIKAQLEIPEMEQVDSDLKLDPFELIVSEDGRDGQPVVEGLDQDKLEAVPQLVQPKSRKVSARKTLSRAETLWLVFGVGFIAIILSVVSTLLIMAGINDTLDFNRLQSIQSMETSLSDLERQLVDLSAGLDSVDRRLEPLEGLSGRMVAVEEEIGLIQTEVEDALFTVGTMQTELDFVLTETVRLSDQVVRFDNFLDGLSELMRVITDTEFVE
jgi:competence ComEA-like helix-hairpin-helix protein